MILHIITSLNVGGAELMLERLITSFPSTTKNAVVSLTGDGKVGERLRLSGITVYDFDIRKTSLLKLLKDINKVVKKEKPTLIQSWLYHADFIGSLISVWNRIPIYWNIRQTKFLKSSSLSTKLIMRVCVLFSYAIPKKIVCAANASKFSHIKYGYCQKKMCVIPNGFVDMLPNVDKSFIENFKLEKSISDSHLIITIAGRYHPDKDYDNFISASSVLTTKFPCVRFLMVGRGLDNGNAELVSKLKSSKIFDKTVLIGETTKLACYLYASDIFCLSSKSEGFPNVLGEAMMLGLPCVSTDCGDARIILGDCGEIVPIENPSALSACLEKLINLTPSERKELGQRSRSRVKKHFSMQRCLNLYYNLYHNKCVDLQVS